MVRLAHHPRTDPFQTFQSFNRFAPFKTFGNKREECKLWRSCYVTSIGSRSFQSFKASPHGSSKFKGSMFNDHAPLPIFRITTYSEACVGWMFLPR